MQHRVVKRLAGLTNNLMAQLPQTKVMKIENVEDALEIPYNEDNSS
jgi:hypothetical protein